MDFEIVDKIVTGLFPRGSALARNAGDVAPPQRYFVIPGENGPRWIVPQDPRYGWPVLRQWRPHKPLSRHIWTLLRTAYRSRLLGRVPGIASVGITGRADMGWKHLGWNGNAAPVPVIYVGTPGPRQKTVACLVDRDTAVLTAVAKAPLGDKAVDAIRSESAILDALADEMPGYAPRSLFVDPRTGISVQEPVAGNPTGRRLDDAHLAWLCGLVIPEESISLREVARGFARQMDDIKRDKRAGSLDILERTIGEIDDATALPAVWMHGDFAPWNLKRAPDGSLRAIDWEVAAKRGIPLFDLVYFYSIQAFLFGEKELFPRRFLVRLRCYIQQVGIASAMVPKIMDACLVQDWLRCRDDGDEPRAAFLLQSLAHRRSTR